VISRANLSQGCACHTAVDAHPRFFVSDAVEFDPSTPPPDDDGQPARALRASRLYADVLLCGFVDGRLE